MTATGRAPRGRHADGEPGLPPRRCLEQLRLAARGGAGLETFYGRPGWAETGRWPGALRLGDTDDRDEVLMLLAPL